jgi:hypothetical protein
MLHQFLVAKAKTASQLLVLQTDHTFLAMMVMTPSLLAEQLIKQQSKAQQATTPLLLPA